MSGLAGAAGVRLEGSLVIAEAAAQQARLRELLDTGVAEVDLSAVAECDTAGVQLLLAVRRRAAAGGLPLRLTHPSAAVAEALRRCGATAVAA